MDSDYVLEDTREAPHETSQVEGLGEGETQKTGELGAGKGDRI